MCHIRIFFIFSFTILLTNLIQNNHTMTKSLSLLNISHILLVSSFATCLSMTIYNTPRSTLYTQPPNTHSHNFCFYLPNMISCFFYHITYISYDTTILTHYDIRLRLHLPLWSTSHNIRLRLHTYTSAIPLFRLSTTSTYL